MNKGQSLFELTVAIGIIGLILLTLVSLATISVRNASSSRDQSEAGRVAQEAYEWLRSERDRSWTAFVGHATSSQNVCLPVLSWVGVHAAPCTSGEKISGLFFREITFTPNPNVNPTRIDTDILVYWTDARGRHEVKNSTFLTNWNQ